MRISWLVLVCSSIAFTLAGCAEGPATTGAAVRYATNAPHVRETQRLAAPLTHQTTVPERPTEPLRLVTDHDRRAHK